MELTFKHFDEVDSTNSALKKLIDAKEGTVLTADYQTGGRGTGTNQWESEHGKNITGSIVLKPGFLGPSESFLISMAVSVGIAAFVSKFDDTVQIKWPNDIYLDHKKLAGILIENEFTANTINRTIAGIGLNVNQTRFKHAPNPIAISQIANKKLDIPDLRQKLFNSIYSVYQTLQTAPVKIIKNYHSRLYGKDIRLEFEDVHGRFTGRIQRVAPDGQLIILDEQNDQRFYYFKEVKMVQVTY